MITFGIDGSRAVAKIRAFEGVLSDMTPAYRAIGNVLISRINLCFKLGIDPWGRKWQAIKWRAPRVSSRNRRPTAAGKRQILANQVGKSGQPLVNTGNLRDSITSKPDARGVTVGTSVKYARVHQFGATIEPKGGRRLVFPGPTGAMIFAKRVTIPGRPYMPIRKGANQAALPTEWAIAVIRSLRTLLVNAKRNAP